MKPTTTPLKRRDPSLAQKASTAATLAQNKARRLPQILTKGPANLAKAYSRLAVTAASTDH